MSNIIKTLNVSISNSHHCWQPTNKFSFIPMFSTNLTKFYSLSIVDWAFLNSPTKICRCSPLGSCSS